VVVYLLCQRVAIIDEGRIVALDTVKNLVALLGGGVFYIGLARVDETIITQLSALPAVKEAQLVPQPAAAPLSEGQTPESGASVPATGGPIVKITAQHNQKAIVNVISFLNEQDVALTSLEILEPNLETVFLHLTGKKLRE
jgi:ABC-2 type transport system ATP-binding protein